MKSAVINHFYSQKNTATSTNSSTTRAKISRTNGEVTTEQDAIERREEEERKKARQLKKAEKALAQNNKKLTRKQRTSNKSTDKPPKTLIDSVCFECSIAYAADYLENQHNLIPCEKCVNWVCPSCLPDDFHI